MQKITMFFSSGVNGWTETLYNDYIFDPANPDRRPLTQLLTYRMQCSFPDVSLFAVRVTELEAPFRSRYFTSEIGTGPCTNQQQPSANTSAPWLGVMIRQRDSDR